MSAVATRRLRCTLLALALCGAAVDAACELRWSAGGRLQGDQVRFRGAYSTDGASHGTGYLRRAGLEGSVAWHARWSAALELELDSAQDVQLDSAWLRALLADDPQGANRIELRAGRIDPDVGLEQATSSNWTWGVERSAIWDLAPDVADALEGTGVRLDGHASHGQFSAGLYDKRSHRAAALRTVWVPLRGASSVLHLGLSLAATSGLRDDGRIRSRLGVRGVSEHGDGRRSTLAAAAADPDAYQRETVAVLEAALRLGAWQVQSEWLQRRLEARAGGPERIAQGAYLLAAWTVRGAGRRYDIRRARIGAPTAPDNRGSVELFVRLDRLEVREERSARSSVLGASWSDGRFWRVALEGHRAETEHANAFGQRRGEAYAARLQLTF